MARKKTLEELRAGARKRSKRWREKNKATHRERVLELYGRAKAQGFFVGGVRPEELIRLDQAMKKGGAMDQPVTDNVILQENEDKMIYAPIEGWDEIAPNWRGGRGQIERNPREHSEATVGPAWDHTPGEGVRTLRGADRRVSSSGTGFKPPDEARGADGRAKDEPGTDWEDSCRPGQKEAQTANEKETYRRFEELRARQAAGKLNALWGPGVEVDIVV